MLKYALIVLLCLAGARSSFADEPAKNIDIAGFPIMPSALYAYCGNAHLLAQDFELALLDFQRASASLQQSEGRYPIIELFIHFGEAIVYDKLNLREHCDQSLISLILTVNELKELQVEEEDDDDDEEEEDEEFGAWEQTLFFDVMTTLANLSPSLDVREVLHSVVNDIKDD